MKKFLALLIFSTSTLAVEKALNTNSLEYAQVTHVVATQKPDNSWCFNTSVQHNDQGWEHYADGWEVSDLNGNQLGYRLLAHPHNNEQPFTRNLCNVEIPSNITQVVVRSKCNIHGYGGKAVIVDLAK